MALAYHEQNKREYELTRHISVRQLNPLALLRLKATGSCEVTLPEWLLDLDGPGHYMRRIKSVSLSIPSAAGPYTSVNCTLTLLKSSVRKAPAIGDGYARQGSEDSRFTDYFGSVQSIVSLHPSASSITVPSLMCCYTCGIRPGRAEQSCAATPWRTWRRWPRRQVAQGWRR